MKNRYVFKLIATLALVAGCGSDSTSEDSDTVSIQGSWTTACEPLDGQSSRWLKNTFTGNSFVFTTRNFQASTDCTSDQFIDFSAVGTFSITGEETTVTEGDARHIDMVFSRGEVSVSTTQQETFVSEGTDLGAYLLSIGIVTDNINNIPVDQFDIVQPEFYTIYYIDTEATPSSLRLGDNTGSFPGLSATDRPVELEQRVYLK